MANNLLRSLALVSAVALIPAATAALAQVDADTYRELDQFMSVLERVQVRICRPGRRQDPDPRRDRRHAGQPRSAFQSYLDERGFSSLMTTTDGNMAASA